MRHYRILALAVLILPFTTAQKASAQNLSVVSGDGQITAQNNLSNYPLVVVATDGSGKPVAGVRVNWTLSGPGNVSGNQTVTGSDGQTSNQFVGATIYGDTAFTQSTVTASTANSSVSFHATTSGADYTTGSIFVTAEVVSPVLGQVLSDAGATPIVQVHVSGIHQAGVQQVPNVSTRLIPDNPSGPTLACAAGTGITDTTGIGNCRVVFGGPIGNGSFSIEVGGFRTFSPFLFSVTRHAGQPATLVITGGSNQSGQPGAQLPSPLAARVQDAAGNALSNVAVVWQPVNAQAVSLSRVVSTSDANGMVSAIATLGSAVGATQVQLHTADGAAQVVFNLTVTQSQPPSGGQHGTPASILITGGNNQSGASGASLPAPLTAKILDSAGNPVSGAPVTWQAVNAQAVSLSNFSSTSDANGIVTAIATAGSAVGPTQVQLRTTGAGIPTPFGIAGGVVIQAVFNLTVVAAQPGIPRGALPTSFRITGGNNQSGPPGARLPAALTAQVLDSAGNPVPNVPVVWQVVNPQAVSLSGVVSTSDANGMVSATATLGSVVGPAQVQVQSTASIAQTPFGPAGSPIQAAFNLTVAQSQATTLLVVSGNNQSGLAGAHLPLPLVAKVVDAAGNPVPNVAVTWQPLSPVSLSGVVSTSDANGLVSAAVTLGNTPGPAQVQIRTGSGGAQTTFNLSVTQPQPAALRILSGNNQSGAPGAPLPVPLSARVEDASGNPLPNVAVVWQSLNPQSITLTSATAMSDANGLVSAVGTLGPSAGLAQVQVRVANATAQTVFTVQAVLTLTGIAIAGGDNQQAAPGSDFGQLLTAQLLALGGQPAGFPVQFTTSGATVFLSNGGVAVTDANGRATVSVQAGSAAGVAVVTASTGNFAASFTLTIQAPPAPLSFFNGASFQPGAVNPAGILAIYGTGLAPGVTGCVAANQAPGPLPMLLSGVTVQFASPGYTAAAPLYSVCNLGTGQEYVVVQTPADLPPGAVTVTVQAGGSPVGQSDAPAALASPGIFTTAMSDGVKRAALRRPDGTNVSLESPAQAGERLQAFVTGLGRPVTASGIALNTNQSGISGDDAAPPNPVTITVAGEVVQPVSATYATDMIGVYIITFDVPADAPSGADTAFTVSTTLPDQSVLSDSTKLPIQ